MSYLEDAAAELRKAAEAIDRSSIGAAAWTSERLRIADGYTRLAAIEAGLPPCLGGHSITEEGSAGA